MPAIQDIQDAVTSIAASVGPKVVGVLGRRSAGSGVVIGPNRILTNAHNVWGEPVAVVLPDGRQVDATTVAVDGDADIAVLEAETTGAEAIDWAAGADGVDIGAPVFAVANPGGRGLRVTFGLVSGTQRAFRGPRGRRIRGSVEHTAPLLPGSSGGPVVDATGRLIGINTHRIGEGFYLAIPADDALRARVDSLGRGEAPKRRHLGIAVAPAGVAKRLRRAVGLPEVDGVLVRGVEDDGPADRAGLKQGDLITRVGDRPVTDPDELVEAIEAGATELAVLRGAEEVRVTVSWED
jgi:serine protease Do